MAPVRDRGQILLVGGLALAVALVALALVLNTAIYTENLASRNDDASIERAIGFQQATVDQVETAMAYAVESESTYADQETVVEEGVGSLNTTVPRYEAADGVAASVTYVGSTEGRRLYQSSEAPLDSDEGDEGNWTVAEDVEHTRNFRLSLDRGSLPELALQNFEVRFDGDDDYRVTFYEPTVGAEEIRVRGPGGLDETCVADGSGDVVVDLTEGTVDGEPCEALGFVGSFTDEYDVEFVNGDVVDGTYTLTVDGTVADTDNVSPGGGAEREEVVYSTTVKLTYRTGDVGYATELRVTPGEADG